VRELAIEESEEVVLIVTSQLKEGSSKDAAKGIEEGQLKAIQDDVLEILQARFKRIPAGLRDSLKSIRDRRR
jgi:hypothetical protein